MTDQVHDQSFITAAIKNNLHFQDFDICPKFNSVRGRNMHVLQRF